MVTGRVGESCALAGPANAVNTAIAAATVVLVMGILRSSVRADAGFADRLRPALHFLRQILGEILGAAALGRHDLEAELLQLLADAWIVERVAHRLVHLRDDRRRRSLREEERVPHAGLDAGHALLTGGRELRDDRHPLLRHHGDALDGALLGLRG